MDLYCTYNPLELTNLLILICEQFDKCEDLLNIGNLELIKWIYDVKLSKITCQICINELLSQ